MFVKNGCQLSAFSSMLQRYSQPGLFRRVLALQCLVLVYTVVTLFTKIESTWNFYRSILAPIFHLDLQNLIINFAKSTVLIETTIKITFQLDLYMESE